MAPLSILIIGGGIAGPTLATFLLLSSLPATQKPHITILERAPSLRAQGQNIDIRGAGLTIIRKLGLETAIRDATTGEEGVQWVDEKNRVWAAFAADRSGKYSTPTADIEILRGHLAQLCYVRSRSVSDQVKKEGGKGIEYLFGDYIEKLTQDGDGVVVRFKKNGKERRFDLVVGADGLQSRTRSMVWGQEGEAERVKRLGMYAGYFSMPWGKTDSFWRRWFRAPGRRGIMLRPDKQNMRTTVLIQVINEADPRLSQVAARGPTGIELQKTLLKEYFQEAGWESERVIEEMMVADDFYYDLVGQVKMERWSKGRVVLLGDAGYCASPISGMGTTLALSGAYNLAGALLRHPDDYTTAFEQYETTMRPNVDLAQKLAPGQPHILNPETVWGVWTLQIAMFIVYWTGLVSILVRFMGPPAKFVAVEEYGFQQLPEMTEPLSKERVSHEND